MSNIMLFDTSFATWKDDENSSVDFASLTDECKDRILIVDDDKAVRKLFSDCLSEKYTCFTVPSVNDALATLKEEEFALVITDMIMPGLSGIELVRKIIEIYPYTASIMVSGINQPQRALDAVRLGAFDYLFKPCDLDVLELTVERALERRRLILNARQYKLDLELRNNELARSKAELERLQAQIIHSEKMASLGQLAAGIAHELNNPVGFVYGNLELLDQNTAVLRNLLALYENAVWSTEITSKAAAIKESSDYSGCLDDLSSIISDCRDGAERIRNIVQNLRTFSRLDEAEFKKTDIHEGIDSTIRLLSRYFTADHITLVRDYGDLPLVDTFSGQLNQLWMNLLINAAQSLSQKGGRVTITTRDLKEFVTIAVTDNGCGIAPVHLNRIFDPFYTTKPVGEGTGLGLSISFGIVERHNGSIKVESRLNEGTTFCVTLPTNVKKRVSVGNTRET